MKSEKTKIEESIECIADSTMRQCKKIIELETELSKLNDEIAKEKSLSQSYEAIIQSLTKENEKLRNSEQLDDKEEIKKLQEQIERYSGDLLNLNKQIINKNHQIIECEQRVKVLDDRNKRLSESMKNYKEIDKVFKSLDAKNKVYQRFIYETMRIELGVDEEEQHEQENNL